MVNVRIHTGDLTPATQSLEEYFRDGGVSIIQAAFEHSYFVQPDKVRAKLQYYPKRARTSREHYPGLTKGAHTTWDQGDGRPIVLDDNSRAQMAWEKYTSRKIVRRTGYGLRHVWGNTHNPDAFTAGWNFCYMPFWAGMLTEDQHPHRELQRAIRQASWDLYFSDNPVCDPPDFVENPDLDLITILGQQPLLILDRETPIKSTGQRRQVSNVEIGGEFIEHVKEIRSATHQSWSNICKAVRALQGKEHQPFGTPNVASSAKSCVRKIQRETGLTYAELETMLHENGFCQSR